MNHHKRVEEIAELVDQLHSPITIAFSGGKDSSAVVKLLWAAARILRDNCPPMEIVYCDTEVENIIVDRIVKDTLHSISTEAQEQGLPITTRIIQPEVSQSFFVRICGRGYPTPTHSFRWCTKDIRIRPFKHFLGRENGKSYIAIGSRLGESNQRDRSIKKHTEKASDSRFTQRQKDGFANATLITPIIDYDTADVWELLTEIHRPHAIDTQLLARTYKDGSGECPTIRDFRDKPCTKARFGCWTCTVVRRDRSSEALLGAGHLEIEPYLRFRSWLADFRNQAQNRCTKRRNGSDGLGPFTILARHEILSNLRILENETSSSIVDNDKTSAIARLVELDVNCKTYRAMDPTFRGQRLPLFGM